MSNVLSGIGDVVGSVIGGPVGAVISGVSSIFGGNHNSGGGGGNSGGGGGNSGGGGSSDGSAQTQASNRLYNDMAGSYEQYMPNVLNQLFGFTQSPYGPGQTPQTMLDQYVGQSAPAYDRAINAAENDLIGRGLLSSSLTGSEVGSIRQAQAQDAGSYYGNLLQQTPRLQQSAATSLASLLTGQGGGAAAGLAQSGQVANQQYQQAQAQQAAGYGSLLNSLSQSGLFDNFGNWVNRQLHGSGGNGSGGNGSGGNGGGLDTMDDPYSSLFGFNS